MINQIYQRELFLFALHIWVTHQHYYLTPFHVAIIVHSNSIWKSIGIMYVEGIFTLIVFLPPFNISLQNIDGLSKSF